MKENKNLLLAKEEIICPKLWITVFHWGLRWWLPVYRIKWFLCKNWWKTILLQNQTENFQNYICAWFGLFYEMQMSLGLSHPLWKAADITTPMQCYKSSHTMLWLYFGLLPFLFQHRKQCFLRILCFIMEVITVLPCIWVLFEKDIGEKFLNKMFFW